MFERSSASKFAGRRRLCPAGHARLGASEEQLPAVFEEIKGNESGAETLNAALRAA